MAELRRDPVIGQWVVVASDKESLTPVAYERISGTATQKKICQFCPGRESYTPPEIDACRSDKKAVNHRGWSARVVPNKFPALRIEGQLEKRGMGLYDMSNGVGAHEIVIETAEHDLDLPDLAVKEIADVLRLYQRRASGLAQDPRFKYIMIFKNHGEAAGASVEHAHSQIIALPMVPKLVLAEMEGVRHYSRFRERCLFCDIIEQEYDEEERIIIQNDRFLNFCPFVPRFPFEHWIMPKEHRTDFFAISDTDVTALAEILKEALTRMKKCLKCAYNFYIHTAPIGLPGRDQYHWHIEIVPQLVRGKGYEWGTGLYQVPTSPAVAAGYLRDVDV
ncbi:MAG: galactose-1-phosphate uridylyltransferase [Candidatus Omnitrophota bacterium]